MARLVLPSRLELNRRVGSSSEAPLRKVSLTILLYVSPVQISPSCDQTGTPRHFHSSTTSESACLMRARTRESVLPLQSPSSLILASISRDGDSPLVVVVFFMLFASHGLCISRIGVFQKSKASVLLAAPALSSARSGSGSGSPLSRKRLTIG